MPVVSRTPCIAIAAVVVHALSLVPSVHAAPAGDQRTSARHLRIINATFDSVAALAVAPAGSAAFVDTSFHAPLQGGLTSTMVSLPAGDCLRDVRVTFLNGRIETYPSLDVCRYNALRLSNGGGKPFRPALLVAGQ
ncbi:MAG: hypothetical protein JO278_05900 [Dyella sp.]|nr:hypothetical protein [Dyella sp.]